ncbi:partner of Y14 and mago [Galendromus occidentalis]|uniref:Partner of Y14 and mago n=1 Tax=Galendromus occidentalis TaxID=34638 RepID=A0AAJ6VXU2_9ACAR|nr:partner of Y14 and mago [Galendromus occidentalis]
MADPGSFIPASQRPDGTWRKARRVKEGYIPQDEVPKYESRGRQLARAMKPEFPPGLSPAQMEAFKKKQAEIANPELAAANKSKKKKNKKKQQAKESKENNNVVNSDQKLNQDVISLENGVKTLTVNSSEENGAEKPSDLSKRLRALRKKVREIESLQEKITTGSCQPNKEQSEKIQRKSEIEAEIRALEEQQQELTS